MILNIHKPKDITSHDVVDRVRKITDERRVGHAGTLDPFATGVLVVGVTRESTKKLGDISKNSRKEYIAILELGKISDTYDSEGVIKKTKKQKNIKTIKKEEIISVFKEFQGKIKQRPPKFSAVKVNGRKSYERARKGEDFELPEKEIEVFKIELVEFTAPYLKILVECGSGTYIRSLARDIGEKLGTGAYLTELTRTRVGDYKIEDSLTLEEFKNNFDLQFKNK
jgi:tRNA pseudouridine55 synthase